MAAVTLRLAARAAVVVVCLSTLLTTATAATGDTQTPNVVHYEPELPNELEAFIHPYAYAHKYPDPTYSKRHTPYTPLTHFDSFVELSDHIHPNDAPSLVQTEEMVTQQSTGPLNFMLDLFKQAPKDSMPPEANPFDDQSMGKLTPVRNLMEQADGVPVGAFPGRNNYRRAVYGPRRRRMPYTGFQLPFGNTNPFHSPNHFQHNANDMFTPRRNDRAELGALVMSYPQAGFGNIFGGYNPADISPESAIYGAHYAGVGGGGPSAIPAACSSSCGGGGGFNPNLNFVAPPIPGPLTEGTGYDSFRFGGGAPGQRFDGEKFMPTRSPFAGGPSPYVGGSSQFFDFYGGGGEGAAGGSSSAGGDSGAVQQQTT